MNTKLKEKNSKLRSIFPDFKSISDKLKDAEVSTEFWKKEQENIIKAVAESKKQKESMRMTPEKFRQPFTIQNYINIIKLEVQMNKNLPELLEYVKNECIKENINMLIVYKVLQIIKNFYKN